MEKKLTNQIQMVKETEFYGLPAVETINDDRQLKRITAFASNFKMENVSNIEESATFDLLVKRYKDTMFKSRKNNLNLICLGYGSIFTSLRVYRGPSTDWLVAPLLNDPAFRENKNKLCVPKNVKRILVTCVKSGIDFDNIFIAHEVPKGSIQPGKPIDLNILLPTPSKEQNARLSFIEKLAEGALLLSEGLIVLLDVAIRETMELYHFAESYKRNLSRHGRPTYDYDYNYQNNYHYNYNYDPILFGVQVDPCVKARKTRSGLWYYITHWRWGE